MEITSVVGFLRILLFRGGVTVRHGRADVSGFLSLR